MKINLTKKDLVKFQRIVDMKYLNMEADDFFSDYLQNDYLSVTSEDMTDLIKCQAMSKKDAFLTAWLMNKDISPEDPEILRMKEEGFFDKIDCLNDIHYKKNLFSNSLRIQEKSEGSWALSYNYYQPYEGFLYDDLYSNPNHYFSERNSIGFFERKVPYLVLKENDIIWMSITPFEINTMKKPIEQAHGNVITFGLGLGYFAYMAINNSNVDHVTIIEKDKKAIKIFENEILPRIRLRNKLTILEMDAFDYAKEQMPLRHYDYAFFDIYHSADDGIDSYIRMKKLESFSPRTEFTYWIENSMLALLRRYVITLMEENLNGYSDPDYQIATNKEEKLLNKIYSALKDKEFKTYEEIHDFLLDENLKRLAKSI